MIIDKYIRIDMEKRRRRRFCAFSCQAATEAFFDPNSYPDEMTNKNYTYKHLSLSDCHYPSFH